MNKILLTTIATIYLSAGILYATPILFNSGEVKKESELIPKESDLVAEQVPVMAKQEFKTVDEIIEEKSLKYNLNSEMMKKVIFCESSFNENSIHDGGRGQGVTGYHRLTFLDHSKLFFKATGQELNHNSTNDQIELMTFIFANYPNERWKWTSYNKLKRYGECNNGLIKKMGIQNININP